MIFQSPGREIFELGPITLRWYGVLIATGFYAALQVARYLARKRGDNVIADLNQIDNFAFIALISGIVGARLWFVLLNPGFFLVHPDEIVMIWHGGISIQGALVGAMLGLWLCVKDKTQLLYFLGIGSCVTPLAQATGRWGNFFNEEAYGKVTDLPWGLYISHSGKYHHPTFLYESIWDLLIFLLLFTCNLKFYSKDKQAQFDQLSIASYLILYSAGRLAIENIRTDSLYIGIFPAASVVSVVFILAGLLIISFLIYKETIKQ